MSFYLPVPNLDDLRSATKTAAAPDLLPDAPKPDVAAAQSPQQQLYNALFMTRSVGSVDELVRAAWRGVKAGALSADFAEQFNRAAEGQRNRLASVDPRSPMGASLRAPARGVQRVRSRIELAWRARQQTRMHRRREQAARGFLPPAIARFFTHGQHATLAVVAECIKRFGKCDWPVRRIADLAGVGRTTARAALRLSTALGQISIEERRLSYDRSLTNVITVLDPKWLNWLRGRGKQKDREKGGGVGNAKPSHTERVKRTEPLPNGPFRAFERVIEPLRTAFAPPMGHFSPP